LGAGAKAKSVTNNLPILSVLGFRCNLYLSRGGICLLNVCLFLRISKKKSLAGFGFVFAVSSANVNDIALDLSDND
jgi:hypothetical protein